MTPEQTPSWWHDFTLTPKQLARKRLRYAYKQTEDPDLRAAAEEHTRRKRAGRAMESTDPFSEQAIAQYERTGIAKEKPPLAEREPFPGNSGPFAILDPRAPDEFEAQARAGKLQRLPPIAPVQAPDETIIKTPERTVVRTTRKLPETPETAQIPVVRRGRRNNGAIRRSIPEVEVGVPPELVQGSEHRQEVKVISPFNGQPIPARPGTPIVRPKVPYPPVEMRGKTPAAEDARRAILAANSPESAERAIPPIVPPLSVTQHSRRHTFLPTRAEISAAQTVRLPSGDTTHVQPVPLSSQPTQIIRNPSPYVPLPPLHGNTQTVPRLPMLPGARNRHNAVMALHAVPANALPGVVNRRAAVNAVRAPGNLIGRMPAQPPVPAQNTAPTQLIPVINQQAAQQPTAQQAQPQIPQPARVQHTPIYGVNPGILLLAGMGLVAVNFMGQVLGSANSVTSLADLLLHAPAGKTRGIFSKLPANTLGTLLAETALVVFLALVMGNINNFTNFLATGIIGLFWLIWLIENGDKLANIWKSVTGAIAGITKGGTSKGWTLPGGLNG